VIDTLLNTVNILSSNFGVVLALIILLYAIQRITSTIIITNFNRSGYYLSACFGVTIHELSHAILCIPFGHKIIRVAMFKPDSSGTLGYVEHSYNGSNIYHQIGNFFIGIAPIAGGTLTIILLTVACLPNGQGIIDFLFSAESDLRAVSGFSSLILLIQSQVHGLLGLLFSAYEQNKLAFFAWLYLSSSVALQLSPSPADLKGAYLGGGLFIVVLSCMSLVIDTEVFYKYLSSIIIPLSTVLILCITLALMLSSTIYVVSKLLRR